jgi:hypothetical protein
MDLPESIPFELLVPCFRKICEYGITGKCNYENKDEFLDFPEHCPYEESE